MPVLCKFAYELILGLLHSCFPRVKKKKDYRKVIPCLFFCYFSPFFSAAFLPLLSFVHVGK